MPIATELVNFIKSAITPIAMFDRDLCCIAASDAWERDCPNGTKWEGCRVEDFPPSLLSDWGHFISDALQGKTCKYIEKNSLSTSTRQRWQFTPWHKKNGEVGGVVISFVDYRSRLPADDDKAAIVEWYNLAQTAAEIGVWDWDIRKSHYFLSAEYYKIIGVPVGQPHSYANFLSAIHPEDRCEVDRCMRRALKGEIDYNMEFRITRKCDGKERWIKDKGTVVFDGHGAPIRAYGALYDITEEKIREDFKDDDIWKLRHVFSAFHEGIWVVDRNAITTYVNSSMASMLGYSQAEMIGRSLYGFMTDEWRDIALKKFQDRSNGVSETHKFQFLRKDRSQLEALLAADALFDEQGFSGCIAVVVNPMERKVSTSAPKRFDISESS